MQTDMDMRMLEIGSTVFAHVKSTSSTALVAEFEGHEIFVDRLEFFWSWPPSLSDDFARVQFPVGRRVPIFILRYLYPVGQYLGSIRRGQPEANPYLKLSLEAPGTIFEAIVVTPYGFAGGRAPLVVSIYGGLMGTIPSRVISANSRLRELKAGEKIPAQLDYLDVWVPEFSVVPAAPTRDTRDGGR